MSFNVQADRNPPAVLKPISKNGTIYTGQFELNESGFSLSLVAKKASDNSVIWTTKIYSGEFDKKLETDVQEIYLQSLKLKKDKLIAVDESGQIYEVESSSGKLLKPKTAVNYSKDR